MKFSCLPDSFPENQQETLPSICRIAPGIPLTVIFLFLVVCFSACSDQPEISTATKSPEVSKSQPPTRTVDDSNNLQDGVELKIRSGTPTPAVQDLVIAIWHSFDDQTLLAFSKIIDLYRRLNPGIQFVLTSVPHYDLFDRYSKAVSSGSGPTILFGDGNWGPSLFDQGLIVDLKDHTSYQLTENLNKAAAVSVDYRNSLIGLPYSIKGIVLYRNSSIIPSNPQNLEELFSFSQAATHGREIGAYLELGDLYAFPMMAACGGSLLDYEGFPAFNNDTGLCWIDLLQSFSEAGPTTFSSDEDYRIFKEGRVGLIFEGTWQMKDLLDTLGDQLNIAPWPVYIEHRLSGYVWTENIYLNPNVGSDELKAGIKFSEFMLAPGSQTILANSRLIPSLNQLEVDDRLINQAIRALSDGTPFPTSPLVDYYWDPMHKALKDILSGDQNPNVILQTASEEIEAIISTSLGD